MLAGGPGTAVIAPAGRRRTVAIAFLMQNSATGLTFGSFGAIVLALQSRYATSLPLASLGLSLVILALCLVAPVVGSVLPRVTIRRMMAAGIVVGAVAYAALAFAPDIGAILWIYALLVGPSLAMFGVLTSNTLVSNWYREGQGRPLGIINMPLMVMLVPLVSIHVVERFGLSALFLGIAAFHLLLLPLALAVRDHPPGLPPVDLPAEDAAPAGTPRSSNAAILKRPAFWLLVVGLGIVIGMGTMKIAHLVPLIVDRGRTAEEGAMLLAISGGSGIVGSLLFGWLADRYGAAWALALNALVQAGTWCILLLPVGLPLLMADSAISGMCGGGVMSAQGVLFGRMFGQSLFPRVMGLMSLATLPFLFGAGPVVAIFYERTGDYLLPVAGVVAVLLLTAPIFASLAREEKRSRAAPQPQETLP